MEVSDYIMYHEAYGPRRALSKKKWQMSRVVLPLALYGPSVLGHKTMFFSPWGLK
jgi:hypothetical protein